MKPLLEVSNLSYSYPDGTNALTEISLRIETGENVALLGPNGSGKTTLLLHLNGTLLGSGKISVAGISVNKHTLKEIRREVGIVFQDPDGQLFMPTVLGDVMFGLLNMGCERTLARDKAMQALNQVGLSPEYADRPPFHLSAGEKRRVALAGVLVMNPKLLILDEPTSWLDPPGQRGLMDLLRTLPQPKLIATHDASFALALTHRAIFLRAGRILADGPASEIIDRFNWRC
jgi:cobalt/nickel transport system ATP-binding protein